jgi:hypothetical protein
LCCCLTYFIIGFFIGAPRKSYQFPENDVHCVPLGNNYTLEIGIISNPYPLVTSQSWSFVDYNGTLHDNLPDNVDVSFHPGVERLTIIVKLIITDAKSINYGNYCLVADNNYGNMTPVVLSVLPEGKYFIYEYLLLSNESDVARIKILHLKIAY